MSTKDNIYDTDLIHYFAETRDIVDVSFTVEGKLLKTECSIVQYDSKNSFIGIRPTKAEYECWIIPLKNIQLIISHTL